MLGRFRHSSVKRAALATVLALGLATFGVAVSWGNSSASSASTPTVTFAKGEPTSSPPPPLNPCTLVTKGEVAAAIHGPVGDGVEAPLGPTCIFMPTGAKAEITVAIEPRPPDLPTKGLQPITVGGHSGFCGTVGRERLFLFLSKYTMLHIDAPCAAADQLAALAAGRIK